MFEPDAIKRYQRQLQAMTKAAGDDDPEALAVVVQLLQQASTEGVRQAVEALRTQTGPAGGYSWADIARPLGITRQTAHERFGAGRAKPSAPPFCRYDECAFPACDVDQDCDGIYLPAEGSRQVTP